MGTVDVTREDQKTREEDEDIDYDNEEETGGQWEIRK